MKYSNNNETGHWHTQEPADVREAESTDTAVFIGERPTGLTVIIGREDSEEWIKTSDMSPITVKDYR